MEMTLPESKVLEKLNDVSTAKRLAHMVNLPFLRGRIFVSLICVVYQELHDSEFGKREEIHEVKRAIRRAVMTESNST